MIALSDVACDFGGPPVFAGVSLTLEQGAFTFLTGPSGAGKTTLLRLIHGDLLPRAGAVRLYDADTRRMQRDHLALTRRRIGFVQQECAFVDHLTVAENVALPLAVAGREDTAACDDVLSWVGLGRARDALPATLSGGERQRAALARAVVLAPDVILADEPTGNVDWDMSRRMLDLLVDLNKAGKTVLIATHDLHLIRAAKSLAAVRVMRLQAGTLSMAEVDL